MTGKGLHGTMRVLWRIVLAAICMLFWLPNWSAIGAAPAAMVQRVASTGNLALYNGDLTVPDGTVFRPGTPFTKTWRIRNAGSVPWTAGYHWRFEAGTLMSNVTSVTISPTEPGFSAIISVPMTAPVSTGVYTSFWQMTDAAGQAFPHQAWVNIVVRAGAASTPALPTATPTSATPTATRAAPTATRAIPTQRPTAVAQPTIVVPGGDGQLVSSAWVGAPSYRTIYAAGSTLAGWGETIAVYYPGPKTAHVRVTLYRQDGAQRAFLFALSSGERRVLPLGQLAPGFGFSAVVEADRQVVCARLASAQRGMLANPGVTTTSRSWLFPELPASAPASQRLLLFNPNRSSSIVRIRVGLLAGGCCSWQTSVTVPPLAQDLVSLGTPTTLHGPLTLFADNRIVAERIVASTDQSTVYGIPGTVFATKHWYLPAVRAGSSGGAVRVFNPGAVPMLATVHVALDEGAGAWLERSIPPFSEITFPLASLTSAKELAAEVDATGPVVASASWTDSAGIPVSAIASAATARDWSLLVGLAGTAAQESLDLLNPSDQISTVTMSLIGGKGLTWRVTMPPHSRYSRAIRAVQMANGSAIVVHASMPIAVGCTMASGYGSAVSAGSELGG